MIDWHSQAKGERTCYKWAIWWKKIQTGARVGHGISRVIKEISCRNSKGQLKKKWFKGNQDKIVEFPQGPWVLLGSEFPIGSTQLCGNFRGEALFCPEFPRIK